MWIELKVFAKWRLKDNHNYVWTNCRKLVNTQKGIEIKKTALGNSTKAGYFFAGNFIKCEELKSLIEIIPKESDMHF